VTVSVKDSGSQSCSISTEHDLATITDANCYQLYLDLNAMQGGASPDEIEVRVYGKARSSDTERLIDYHPVHSTQFRTLWVGKPYASPHYIRFTIKQTLGTGRTVPWAVYQTQ
jgi:hypothetical protein